MGAEGETPGDRFRPAGDPARAEQIRCFMLAQGWAGLSGGDHLQRLESQGLSPAEILWWLPGPSGEIQASALLAQGVLALLVPGVAARPAALELLRERLDQLHRVVLIDGQLDGAPPDDFVLHQRIVTVAPRLGRTGEGLPASRPARRADAGDLHQIYDQVSWMRQDSPELWAERLAREPAWVAELDGLPVAAARWTRSFGAAVEIGGVATRPGFRRRGAASSATLAATAAALEQGRLAVLRYGEEELAALYHPLGFQLVGRELVFYRSH